MSKFFNLICLVFISVNLLTAQDELDFNLIESVVIGNSNQPRHSYVSATKINKDQNELQQSMRYLFLIYKNYFSSQDGNQCSFYPSCSDYSLRAVRSDGLVKGGVKAMDRLVRCNSLSPEKYQIDLKRRKLIDHEN